MGDGRPGCARLSGLECSPMTPRTICGLAALGLLITACGNAPRVPVTDRSPVSKPDVPNTSYRSTVPDRNSHVVRSGDTLFSIAWAVGLDYRELARWNGIQTPYVIQPGQRLKMTPPPENLSKNSALPQPKPAKIPPKSTSTPKFNNKIEAFSGWVWPVEGPILKGFSASNGNKGIDIGGSSGRGVRAAASGKIVYAGSGLRGYGRLIIVKHDEVYLSAYAHNSKLLVEDGAKVRKGQQIALMGDTGTDRVMLHFEIRKRGKPVNPLKFLPTRP